MTDLKTIAGTAVIAVGGTAAAFFGLHLGQAPADAAAAAPATPQVARQTAATVALSAQDIAKLAALLKSQKSQTRTAAHHAEQAHQQHAAGRSAVKATYTAARSTPGSTGQRGSGVTHHVDDPNGDHTHGCDDGHAGCGDGGGCD